MRDGEEGASAHEVMALEEAPAAAKAAGMALVEGNGNASPTVCPIVDYERARHDTGKRAKEPTNAVRPAQERGETKKRRLTAKIDVHDLNVKINGAKKFLDAGNRVTFRIMFKNSDGIAQDKRATRGAEIMDNIISMLEDVEVVLKPKMVGANHMTCSLKRPTKK